MTNYDLFEMTGLPFDDPLEKSTKKINAAIEKVKKELSGALGTATQQLERDVINEKLTFLEATISDVFDGNGKLTLSYEKQAEEKIKTEMDKLTSTAKLRYDSGIRTITAGEIRTYRQSSKLSKDHVEEIFEKCGVSINNTNPLAALPKFPTNAEKTYNELDALRKFKDPNSNGSDVTQITDMYAFAAYLEGEPEKSLYRNKTTSELENIFDKFAKKFATQNDNLGKLCASLSTAGKTYIFNSEENRQAYEAYLKYKSPELVQLFSSIKGANKSDLIDPRFSKQCIARISEVFGDYDISRALYLKESRVTNPEELDIGPSEFHIKCPHCNSLIKDFSSAGDAQKANKCPNCKKAIYKQCNKCKKMVLVSLDKCLEAGCGFVFASAAMFAKHYLNAEQSLRKSDFDVARNHLYQAQSVDPSEKQRVDELSARIAFEEEKYKKPINNLRQLITNKTFQAASNELASVIGAFPSLDVSSFEAQINATLNQAKTSFSNAKQLSPSQQADECLAILHNCADFEPAISFLRSTPPVACKDISINIDSRSSCANVSWTRSSEQGVRYLLVRKLGKDIPISERDGEKLADGISETSYCDRTVVPGRCYSYTVFAVRYGVFSAATGKSEVLLADVSNAHAEQIGTTIRLTWDAPPNCIGASIKRVCGSKESFIECNTPGSIEDKNLEYGKAYLYTLYANYANSLHSKGVELPAITLTPQVDSFSITVKQVKENKYKVAWSIKQRGINMRVLVNEKQVGETLSDDNSCEINLPADGFHSVSALAYSGGDWLRSENSHQINTCAPCVIDRSSSFLREESIVGLQESAYVIELHLKISNPIPSNVSGFYYAVRKSNNQNRWPTAEEVGVASDIHRVGLAAYQKSEKILYTETAREEGSYYVSLFTVYSVGGKEIISDSKRCRFDRPLMVNLSWKVNKSIFGGLKLSLEISANQPISKTPEFVLCACASNQHLLSHDDTKGTHLLTIPATDLAESQNEYRCSYDVNTALSAKQVKSMKFFLFEVAQIPSEKYVLRWDKGFTGKV